ncbi:IMS domain-containing protein [Cyanobium sp. FGCU-52]|nr:IMS domain-containing protein [Cyanobium sp. FGCU52]
MLTVRLVPRLELPIDHFRLLGVGPGTDAQTVLHTYHQRLARVPDQAFSRDTLEARAELLRASADVLSDPERRAAYESDLTALVGAGEGVVPALDIASSREVAGLLLLLEAEQPLECFDLACRALQPPQTPALGSSRESDLTRLAGLSCLAAAGDYHSQRRYEAAAQTLQQGLQLLQRMGQLPELRERMSQELDRLTPYRVLDLLSRDLSAVEERREGLSLLEDLVRRRGGLEGSDDPSFTTEAFQAFFKQIRSFLTVQEQVDLFSRWGDAGSPAADFLATTALTASGFVQRKPERIAAARDRLEASGRSGIEPLLANLHLLLGDVDAAREAFDLGASRELRAWTARQSDDPLAQLCAYCRDWLSHDVLPGYRDIDADPDLDAYFSDRDVIAFVEKEDRRVGRSFPEPGDVSFGESFDFRTSPDPSAAWPSIGASSSFGLAGSSGPLVPPNAYDAFGEPLDEDAAVGHEEVPARRRRRPLPVRGPFPLPLPLPWLMGGLAAVVAAFALGTWALRPRTPGAAGTGTARPIPVVPAARPTPPPPPASRPAVKAADASGVPLQAAEPSEDQLRALLEAWLAAKAAVLAGDKPTVPLDRLARAATVQRLEEERREDRSRGELQKLDVRVKDLAIDERNPQRIAITAELAYSDRRLDERGREVERTAPTTLRNVYIFGRDGGTWRLAATHAAD